MMILAMRLVSTRVTIVHIFNADDGWNKLLQFRVPSSWWIGQNGEYFLTYKECKRSHWPSSNIIIIIILSKKLTFNPYLFTKIKILKVGMQSIFEVCGFKKISRRFCSWNSWDVSFIIMLFASESLSLWDIFSTRTKQDTHHHHLAEK